MMIDRSSVGHWTTARLVVEIVELDRHFIDLLSRTDNYPSIRGCFELVEGSAVQKRRE